MEFQVEFDKARDAFTRSIFLHVLEWDFNIADIEPADPEMLQHIERAPLVYTVTKEI